MALWPVLQSTNIDVFIRGNKAFDEARRRRRGKERKKERNRYGWQMMIIMPCGMPRLSFRLIDVSSFKAE